MTEKERRKYRRKYYKEHNLREKQRRYVVKRTEKWYEWFMGKYGEFPKCQVCGKDLVWKGYGNNVLCFDHRYNGEIYIKSNPSHWVWSHACSEKNRKIWEECNFGILCRACNKRLPTKNREQWLRDSIKYIKGV